MEKKNCPECKILMHKVSVESYYGVPFFIDQCDKCGGLWFDSLELFQTKHGEGERIDDIDAGKLKEKKDLTNENPVCPKDKESLSLFTDPNFPKSLKVESCGRCGGFWMNRGEFIEFQSEREKNRPKEKKEEKSEFEDSIERMLQAHSSASKYDTIGSLAGFLSTPMDRQSMRPLNLGNIENERRAGKVSDIVTSVIQIIFQILLRR